MGRRGFLRGLALGSVAVGATTREAQAGGGAHRYTGYPGRKGLLHDVTLCVGCRSCEAACNQVNGLPPVEPPAQDTSAFHQQRLLSDQLYTVVNRYRPAQGRQPAVYRKHQCMHCSEPCCASVCFVKAFTKTPEGPVLYDPDLCVGCRYCVFACPYYALSYEYSDALTPRVVRCTMCYPRIIQGRNPACADACPNGAILYGDREELMHVARERIRKYPGRYVDHIFGEHEFAGTSWLTIAGMPFTQLGLHEDVTHTPLPDFTTGFLSLAPLVCAIFPGMLGGFYAFTKRRERLARESNRRLAQEMREELQLEMEQRMEQLAQTAAREKQQALERAVRSALRQAQVAPPSPVADGNKDGAQ
jgi:Fe-S-cluster-containing dehydrogenase component